MPVSKIEEELKELAKNDWPEFMRLTGLHVENFEICKRKKKGFSVRQIAAATRIEATKVHRTICKVCP